VKINHKGCIIVDTFKVSTAGAITPNFGKEILMCETDPPKTLSAKASARVNNGEPIADRNSYVENLLVADNNVTKAEKALETHKKKVAFLEAELKALEEELKNFDNKYSDAYSKMDQLEKEKKGTMAERTGTER